MESNLAEHTSIKENIQHTFKNENANRKFMNSIEEKFEIPLAPGSDRKNKARNISLNAPHIRKPVFLVRHHIPSNKKKNKGDHDEFNDSFKTLIEIIHDTESGVPIPHSKEKKLENLTSNKTQNRYKSRKSSNLSNTQSNNSELLGNKMERDNNATALRPRLVKVDGKWQLEKPNLSEVTQKMQEEQSKRTDPSFIEYNEKNKITSLSFRKKLHSEKWDEEETGFFFRCLEFFGTDFSLLEIVLKPRTRGQIKNKYMKEEKKNPLEIEKSLMKFDPDKLYKMLTVIKNIQKKKEVVDYKSLLNDENIFKCEDELNKILNKADDNISEVESEEEFEEDNDNDEIEDNDDDDNSEKTLSEVASSKKINNNIKEKSNIVEMKNKIIINEAISSYSVNGNEEKSLKLKSESLAFNFLHNFNKNDDENE